MIELIILLIATVLIPRIVLLAIFLTLMVVVSIVIFRFLWWFLKTIVFLIEDIKKDEEFIKSRMKLKAKLKELLEFDWSLKNEKERKI